MAWNEVDTGTYAGSGTTIRCGQGPLLTPSSGAITVTDSFHTVSGGSLSTINGCIANSFYLLEAQSTFTIDSPTNIVTTRTKVLTGDVLQLWFDGSNAIETSGAPSGSVSVKKYGVYGDGRSVNCTLSSGSHNFSITGGALTISDIGRILVFPTAGGTGTALATSIATITSPTTGTLTNTPSSSPSGTAYIVRDETTAIQLAIDNERSLVFPDGMYGYTTLRLRGGSRYSGSGFSTQLLCCGVGAGGPTIAMKTGEIAQEFIFENFTVLCAQSGTNRNGVELGTETPGTTDFALGSRISNVEIWDATGYQLRLHVNVGTIDNVWCESGYSTVQSTVGGAYITGGVFQANMLNVEGTYKTTALRAAAGYSSYQSLQIEVHGLGASVDIVAVENYDQWFAMPYITTDTSRDAIRILSGFSHIIITGLSFPSGTVTNLVNDQSNAYTIPGSAVWVPGYVTDPQFQRVERWTNATLPAAGNTKDDGRIGINVDTRDFVYYMGTGRYKLTGTAF